MGCLELPLGPTLDSLWLPWGCPWVPVGRLGALVGPLVGGLGAFGSLSNAFRLPLAVLYGFLAVLGYLWDLFGHLGLPSAVF